MPAAGTGRPCGRAEHGRDPYCAEHDDFAWSPDGQTLVFAAHEACPGQPSLYVVPADGSAQAVKLLAPGTSGALPRFSPERPASRVPRQ